MKYKVGDKVRVIGKSEHEHFLKIGTIATIISIDNKKKRVNVEGLGISGCCYIKQTLVMQDIEPAYKYKETPLWKIMND